MLSHTDGMSHMTSTISKANPIDSAVNRNESPDQHSPEYINDYVVNRENNLEGIKTNLVEAEKKLDQDGEDIDPYAPTRMLKRERKALLQDQRKYTTVDEVLNKMKGRSESRPERRPKILLEDTTKFSPNVRKPQIDIYKYKYEQNMQKLEKEEKDFIKKIEDKSK